MGDAPRLPERLAPMLAVLGEGPFDSGAHSFEIKWDGVRCLAFVDGPGALRLQTRTGNDITERFPELEPLGHLPAGTVVDGEIVVLEEDRPSFAAVMGRLHTRRAQRIAAAATRRPACLVAFDLPYLDYESICERPLRDRRDLLQTKVAGLGDPHVVFSEGVVGAGRALFEEAVARGLEGIVAKRLESPYLPGRRSDAWTKIKVTQRLHCVVIGYVPDGDGNFKSLLLASERQGVLAYAGKAATGIDNAQRRRLRAWLRDHPRSRPITPCDEPALWVEPGLYCVVSFHERTRSGLLRAPVLEELVFDQSR